MCAARGAGARSQQPLQRLQPASCGRSPAGRTLCSCCRKYVWPLMARLQAGKEGTESQRRAPPARRQLPCACRRVVANQLPPSPHPPGRQDAHPQLVVPGAVHAGVVGVRLDAALPHELIGAGLVVALALRASEAGKKGKQAAQRATGEGVVGTLWNPPSQAAAGPLQVELARSGSALTVSYCLRHACAHSATAAPYRSRYTPAGQGLGVQARV